MGKSDSVPLGDINETVSVPIRLIHYFSDNLISELSVFFSMHEFECLLDILLPQATVIIHIKLLKHSVYIGSLKIFLRALGCNEIKDYSAKFLFISH